MVKVVQDWDNETGGSSAWSLLNNRFVPLTSFLSQYRTEGMKCSRDISPTYGVQSVY